MRKADAPSKMPTAEYRAFSSRRWAHQSYEPADFVLSSFYVRQAGKLPRSRWLPHVLESLSEAGWAVEPADISRYVPAGVTPTIAIMAHRFLMYGSEETVLIATPGDVIIFRGCRVYDTAESGTVKRRVAKMFFVRPVNQIGCGCADPVVFGHWKNCRKASEVK